MSRSLAGSADTTGGVRITLDATKRMAGKHLLVIEDIVDTGRIMGFLLQDLLRSRHPVSVKVARK